MSIPLRNLGKVRDHYEEVRDKVKSILGYDVIYSDHYYSAILFNEIITINTDENTIIDISKKFFKLNNDIVNMFGKYEIDFKEEYFSMDMNDGMFKLLGVTVDVYKGIDELEPIIKDFAHLYNKIKMIASKYDGLDERFFYVYYVEKNSIIFYRFYNSCINFKTSDEEIEKTISDYSHLNKKINSLLRLCGYKKTNQLYPLFTSGNGFLYSESREYYLFSKLIDESTNDNELIKIIHMAKLFEDNIKLALKELEINKRVKILYEDGIWIELNGVRFVFSLDMSYDEIKSGFQRYD